MSALLSWTTSRRTARRALDSCFGPGGAEVRAAGDDGLNARRRRRRRRQPTLGSRPAWPYSSVGATLLNGSPISKRARRPAARRARREGLPCVLLNPVSPGRACAQACRKRGRIEPKVSTSRVRLPPAACAHWQARGRYTASPQELSAARRSGSPAWRGESARGRRATRRGVRRRRRAAARGRG